MKYLVRIQVVEAHPSSWHHVAAYYQMSSTLKNIFGSFQPDASIRSVKVAPKCRLYFALRYTWIPLTPCFTVEVFVFTHRRSSREFEARMSHLHILSANHPILLIYPYDDVTFEDRVQDGLQGYRGPVDYLPLNYEEDNSDLVHQTILQSLKSHYKV